MFVANNFAQGFVNGSRGRVIDFQNGQPLVQLAGSGKTIRVEPHSWTLMEDGKKRAEVSQLPLRLAWAITIHKSQGMSLDAAEIDLSKSFTPGMGYVALSRVRTLDGVYLTGMNAMALRLHPAIFEFDARLRAVSAQLAVTTADLPDEGPATEPVVAAYIRMPVNDELLRKLKLWRVRRAQADGVPPYIVAHDTLLEALASHPPATMQQLRGVSGIGPRKLELYGMEILDLTAGSR
jgi:ATP-dependent DNA helicase PIF1